MTENKKKVRVSFEAEIYCEKNFCSDPIFLKKENGVYDVTIYEEESECNISNGLVYVDMTFIKKIIENNGFKNIKFNRKDGIEYVNYDVVFVSGSNKIKKEYSDDIFYLERYVRLKFNNLFINIDEAEHKKCCMCKKCKKKDDGYYSDEILAEEYNDDDLIIF